jgi:hypothetical protein
MSTHKLNKAEFTERVQRKNQYHLAWSLPNLFGAYIKWGLFAAFSYQSGIYWPLSIKYLFKLSIYEYVESFHVNLHTKMNYYKIKDAYNG